MSTVLAGHPPQRAEYQPAKAAGDAVTVASGRPRSSR
jgi:hypothetical protein